MLHHLDVAQQAEQPDIRRGRGTTPYVPYGAKQDFRLDRADDLAELRIINGYRDRQPTRG